ncbi:Phr family secreted Rap phosphatase inhibitor [Bacillus cytotoxicus]|uniref:Phr family secreted Rap phosphatase inhibitor n=1 Tax=Bacillus cytotoxicus TaxID=580165 RepID=UPI000863DBF3|nr:Phr family secreted Rap phosphatase inhibitor [Bacillus cytotoxicus]AWC30460.1 Phr family secreted Rap phosphatase inhibitor [Bacillus cytotoxicus]AWC42601.1 Phr family secreted Rap phosphatase inhibitor [Bacillus cytotoxicus]AWC50532.1 Phr family secreted Rap phosphatase inhibitor [Bacillus cytotoxicus]AWC54587.1 Phr family secreted Rap phosphatase inhibitor [Bacillus cytotoxicus]AWC58710.1 Phr family secreted Rap phosphatase inhibitor [Bacillus cytotoxicus]
MKKLGLIALGLSCVGILSFGVSNDSSQVYAYGDYPAPQRPDLALNIGDAPADNKGDTPAPQA